MRRVWRRFMNGIKMIAKSKGRNLRMRLRTNTNAGSTVSSTSPKYLNHITQTPGTIIFRATGNNGLIQNIDHQLTNPLRLSYKLKTLQFGLGNNFFDFPIAHKSKVVEDYIKDLEGNIATREFVQDFTQKEEKINFYNHLKIIPVVFDENSTLV
jgi:hypothetical protein